MHRELKILIFSSLWFMISYFLLNFDNADLLWISFNHWILTSSKSLRVKYEPNINSLEAETYWIWKQLAKPMLRPRKELGMALIGPDHLWVTGGIFPFETKGVIINQLTRTTELYNFKEGSWESARTLDLPVAGHCMIQVKFIYSEKATKNMTKSPNFFWRF